MKVVKKIFGVTLACALIAGSAYAGGPVHGVYTNLNGDLINGRFGESFSAANGYFTPGNVHGSASWNGAALGTQWSWSCAQVQSAVMAGVILNTEQWNITYNTSNATFFLNGTGEAWDGGDASYTGVIDEMTDEVYAIVFAGSVLGWNSSIDWSGRFDAPYNDTCIIVTLNTAWVGDGANPGDYPAYIDTDCNTPRAFGVYGTATDINIQITSCLVPTEDATWGAIKSLYK